MPGRVQRSMRQCSNSAEGWRDGTAYRGQGRRFVRSNTAHEECCDGEDAEQQRKDTDGAEPG